MANANYEPGRDPRASVPETERVYTDPRPDTFNRTSWMRGGFAPGGDAAVLRNRVQWGPILAGIVVAIAVMLILSVLGLAVGSTALSPREANANVTTGAAIWGIISAIIAFFVGGWVAAKTAAVGGSGSGIMNGLVVGCAILAIILWLTGAGVGALLGTVSGNIGSIVNAASGSGGSTQQQVSQAAQQAQKAVTPQQAFNTVKDAAWGTFIGIILPLIAAALGGWVGHNSYRDIVTTEGDAGAGR